MWDGAEKRERVWANGSYSIVNLENQGKEAVGYVWSCEVSGEQRSTGLTSRIAWMDCVTSVPQLSVWGEGESLFAYVACKIKPTCCFQLIWHTFHFVLKI